ncbi:MBL fold metallo-hydrolase [Paenibacillus thermotolerans]|uniref:MBL fold metallo-hydrolase n=1 Tax=Paenibacillus thermotolerans TaxID=3027807 RepID=UPI002368C38D|nr:MULTISPECIES: MBL fold metallo-hydrolase [unclassified Paenibacillus]
MSMNRKPRNMMDEIDAAVVPEGCVAVWFVGQESIILKGKETVIYIDPWVSDELERKGAKRDFEPPFRPEDIRRADVCLITHEHDDHLDEGTIRVMARSCPETRYVAPVFCRDKLLNCGATEDRLTIAATGEPLTFGEAHIVPVPAAHESLETDEHGRHRYVGYVINMNGVTVYHAGDTVVYPGLVDSLANYKIDLGLLPINGGDYFRRERGIVGNMDYREAAEVAVASGMETVIPLHYDGFGSNGEKPGDFVQYLFEKHPYQKFHVMAQAERFVYVSPRAFG